MYSCKVQKETDFLLDAVKTSSEMWDIPSLCTSPDSCVNIQTEAGVFLYIKIIDSPEETANYKILHPHTPLEPYCTSYLNV